MNIIRTRERMMNFTKKYTGIGFIIFGILSALCLFFPLYTAKIDMYGLAGWKLDYYPLLGVNRESFGIWAPIVNQISQTLNLIPPPNAILISIGFILLFLSIIIIIVGILQIKRSESFIYSLITVMIAIIMMILLNFAHSIIFRTGIGTEINIPNYYISFNKSILVAYLTDLLVIVPRIRNLFLNLNYYLILIAQIIIIIISIGIIIRAIIKKLEIKKGNL
jgi:hypothetical protein